MEPIKTGGKWFSGKYHDERMSDRLAFAIRVTILMSMLFVAFHYDRSDVLSQLSKWPRRALLLLALAASTELTCFIVTKIWMRLLGKRQGGGVSGGENAGEKGR